ncbi:Salicylate hydroxylase [Colletotrichum sidae]|uniref:Salicylate hydroxylase n=1 Tax=Colletotrichum sidae TaxID=1347389 RepID=A0A4R8T7Y9_9PEZI|nr:Salicylate hydroxylase [Colletotrichum sidae]
MTSTTKLRIVIVGGGIAGLAAAAVLRQKHDVTVYDREPADAPERGAGVGLGPNGSKMLKRAFQFDAERVRATVCAGTRTWDKQGNLLREMTGVTEPFGSEWLLMHRQDLKAELLRLATGDAEKLGVSGPPAQVMYGVDVVEVDAERGLVVMGDGSEVEADLVIGADGIHSVVRRAVIGGEANLVSSGVSLYRFVYPLDDARELLGGLPDALEPQTGCFLNAMAANDELNRNVIFYPCRDFTLLNVVARVPDAMLNEESETSWNAEGNIREMLDNFRDFAPWMLTIMRNVEDVRLYKVRDADPLHTYIRGRAIVIGDAAHPMTPFQGQGATQAIEDAEGLRLLLHDGVDSENLWRSLRTWDSVRRPRASQVQQNSRHVTDASAQSQLDRMRLNWTYDGIHSALRNSGTIYAIGGITVVLAGFFAFLTGAPDRAAGVADTTSRSGSTLLSGPLSGKEGGEKDLEAHTGRDPNRSTGLAGLKSDATDPNAPKARN